MKDFIAGIKAALPIIVAYLPIGISFGVISLDSGLNVHEAILMSILVFSPTCQIVAVGLMATGQSIATIVLTTFVMNLRFFIMSLSISQVLRNWTLLRRILFGVGIIDETYIIHDLEFKKRNPTPGFSLSVNLAAQAAFIIGTIAGTLLHSTLPNLQDLGFDFAIPALVIGALATQINSVKQLQIATIVGITVVFINFVGLNTWSILIATFVGASYGLEVDKWRSKKYLSPSC